MTTNEFSKVKTSLRDLCDSIMDDKQPEYTQRSHNVMFNFNLSARNLNLTREKVLYVHLQKHLSSITEYCAGNYNGSESIEKRIADAINYLTLLYAMHVEPVISEDTPA